MKSDWKRVAASVMLFLGLGVVLFAINLVNSDAQKDFMAGQTYGQDRTAIAGVTSPYEIDEANATNTYLRYSSNNVDQLFIKRISVDGDITRIEWAETYWTNRAAATYRPINMR